MDPEPLDPPSSDLAPAAAPPVLEPAPPPPAGWTYWDAVVVVVLAIVAQVVVYVAGLSVVAIVATLRGQSLVTVMEAATRVWFVLPVQIVWWAMVLWIIYKVVRARDPRPFRDAICWFRPALPLGTYLSGGALLAFSVAGLAWLLPKPQKHMPMEELFRDPLSASLLAVFGVLVAPIIEELLFRGFLYAVVARVNGVLAAVLTTAALFSLVHAPQYGWAWQNLLILAYVGIVFGAIRARSGSVVPSTLVHAAYNLTLFVGLYAASDRFRNLRF